MYSIYGCPVWITEVVWLAGLRYKQKAVAQQTLPLCPKHRLENQLQRRDTSTLIELRQENVRTLGDMEITSDTCQFVAIQGLWKGTAKALLWDSCSQSVGVTDTGPWLSKGKSCHSYGCINTVWWNRLTATKSNSFAWKDIIGGYMDCFKVKWCQMQVQWCAMFDVKVMPNKKPSNIVKQTNKVHAQWGPNHGPRLGWRYLYIQFTEMNTLWPKLLPRNQRGFFWILSLLIFVVFESTIQASMVGRTRAEGMTSGQSTHSIQIHPNPLWQGTLGDFRWFPVVSIGSLCSLWGHFTVIQPLSSTRSRPDSSLGLQILDHPHPCARIGPWFWFESITWWIRCRKNIYMIIHDKIDKKIFLKIKRLKETEVNAWDPGISVLDAGCFDSMASTARQSKLLWTTHAWVYAHFTSLWASSPRMIHDS